MATLAQERQALEEHLQRMRVTIEQRDELNQHLAAMDKERLVRMGRVSMLEEQEDAKPRKAPTSRTPRGKTPAKRQRGRKPAK